MGRPSDGEPSDIEFLDAGVPPRFEGDQRAMFRGQRRIALVLALVLVGLVITMIAHPNRDRSAVRPSGQPAARASISTVHESSAARAQIPPAPETHTSGRLLGVRAGWELFGRGDGVVVRIQLATGRITRTAVPPVIGSSPVSFVVGSHTALIRPPSGGPSYLIADGKRTRTLRMADYAGPAFPGPGPDQVWLPSFGQFRQRMVLVNAGGRTTGTFLRVPEGNSVQQATSDATGYVLFPALSGTFDVRPDGPHRITTGTVLAIGPTRWLVRECDDRGGCSTVVIDRNDGRRRVLTSIGSDAYSSPIGTISPDGTTAALINMSNETEDVHLRNLVTGADHPLALRTDLATALNVGSLVWSPDSRWLFIVAAGGRLAVFDNHTGKVRSLGVPLPALSQLAIRRAIR